MARVDLDCGGKSVNRFFEAPRVLQGVAQYPVSRDVQGVQLDGAPCGCDGNVRVAQSGFEVTVGSQHARVSRRERHGARVFTRGLGEIEEAQFENLAKRRMS